MMAQLSLATLLLFLLLPSPLDAALPVRGLVPFFKTVGRRARREVVKDIILKIANQSSSRSDHGIQAQLSWSDDLEYVVELSVGEPQRSVSLIVDTVDDFVWTDCEPCSLCFQQGSVPPAYYSNQSSTFLKLPCNSPQCQQILDNATCTRQYCQYNFSSIEGVLANDTFRFQGSDPLTITFGCNKVDQFNLTDSSGFAGLGRGPLSLISQTSYSKFSYCFTDAFNRSLSSYMFFGPYADLDNGSIPINTTSFVKDWNYYFLDLRGISLGAKTLSIPQATFQYVENTNGTIIDTTSPLTYLVEHAYAILRKELISQIALPEYKHSMDDFGLDLCFNWTSDVNIPDMTFHFAGADMTLPIENFLITNSDETVLCLTMMPNDNYSILGSLQQQNLQFIYDLDDETLSFWSTPCNLLPPHKSSAIKFDFHATTFFVLLIVCLSLSALINHSTMCEI